jgi:vacuolar-type H+-ATPase subunit E/Vma4
LKTLKTSLFNHIRDNINNKYLNYITFLLKTVASIKKKVDKPQAIELIFNSKDYKYFLENAEKIQGLFKNPIEMNQDRTDFIGGFKISIGNGEISYDYTIDTLINKKFSFIQTEISKIVNDLEIKEIENQFKIFIQNQKSKIEGYLKQFDQIQI